MKIIPIIEIQRMVPSQIDKVLEEYFKGDLAFAPLFKKYKSIYDICENCMMKRVNRSGVDMEIVKKVAKKKFESSTKWQSKLAKWRDILN